MFFFCNLLGLHNMADYINHLLLNCNYLLPLCHRRVKFSLPGSCVEAAAVANPWAASHPVKFFKAAAQLQTAGKLYKKSMRQLQKFCYFDERKNYWQIKNFMI